MTDKHLSGAINLPIVASELRKVPAFLRRDVLIMLSYRLAFISDWLNLFLQVVLFYFIGRMVDSSTLPTFNGTRVTYIEFASV